MRHAWPLVIVVTLLPHLARAQSAPPEAERFPSLDEVVARARTHGPAVVLATADVDIAGASRQSAGLPPLTNPYLEVIADTVPGAEGVAVAGSLFLPVEVGGQRGRRIQEADTLVRWKEAQRDEAAARAMAEAVAAYGQVLVAEARLRTLEEAAALSEEDARYVEGRLQEGDATALDAAHARAEVARWAQRRAELEVALARARGRLSISVGQPELATRPASRGAELPPLSEPEALAPPALEERTPTLRAADIEADFFDASRGRWEAERFVPLNLVLTGGRDELGRAHGGVGLAWTFPIFQRNQTEIARARAEKARAERNLELLRRAVTLRGRALLDALNATRRALQVTDDSALPAAQRAVDASTQAWKLGKLDFARVLMARRELVLMRDDRLALLSAAWGSYAELTQLLGALP
ncbi:TolC family protein [Cystobacter ferrugineus]|uniref:Transporter n=1 Tax=Cystobacter ferrugineus TaxID=83449 RepID=A0A1L9BHR4_9BACT|nr:TolC family protein [Cystobacter ferrugineus]OJH41718.1 hypothetical protein BON30_00260 [Cystobacter ferrugineus]